MKKLSLLALVLALPALAQDGFHVGLSAASSKIGGDATVLAYTDYTNTGATTYYGGQTYLFDYKTKTPWQLDFGYKSGDDDFTLSYWSLNAKANQTATAANNNSGIGYGDWNVYYVQTLVGQSEIKSHTVDLAWTHTLVKGDRASFSSTFGLREWKMTQDVSRLGYNGFTPTPANLNGFRYEKTESKGFGASFGIGTAITLNDRFWVSADAKMAFLRGTTDFQMTDDYPGNTSGYPDWSQKADDMQRTFTQSQADLKLNLHIVAGLDGFVGLSYKNFGSALGSGLGSEYGYENFPDGSIKAASVSGFSFGANYRF